MEDIHPSNLDPSPVENDLTQSLQKISLHNILNSQVTQRRGKESPQAHHYMVHAWRAHAGWTIRRIAPALHIPRTTVHRLSTRARQGKFKVDKWSGRPKIITPSIRQKLVTIVTASSHNCCLPFSSLANLIGLRVSQDVIQQGLREDGLNRRVARQKPFFTEKVKHRRYEFALHHAHWGVQHWRRVI